MEMATSDATSTEASHILMDRLSSLRGLVDNRITGAANDIDPRTQLRYADTEQSHKPRSPFSFATRSRGRAGSPKRARRLTSKPAADFAEEPGSDTSDGTHTGESDDDGQSASGSANAAAGAPRGKSREVEKEKDDAGGGRLRRKSAWVTQSGGDASGAGSGTAAGAPPPSAGGAGAGAFEFAAGFSSGAVGAGGGIGGAGGATAGSALSAAGDGSAGAAGAGAASSGAAADGAGSSARPSSRSSRSLTKLAEARAEYESKRRAEAAAMESRLRALATDHASLFADGLVYDPSKPVNKDPRAYDKAQEAAALAKAANPMPAAGGRLGSAASPTRERAGSAVGLGPSSIGGMPTPGSLAARRAADEVAAAAAGINAPLPLDPAMRLTAARIKPGYSARRFTRHYLTLIAAEVVVDCFWLVHCRLFQSNSSYAQECLLESLSACNLRLLQTLHREARFRFLGALPWAVTDTIVHVYTYFVAGSRALYNERFKLEVGLIIGRVLTGVEVAPVTVLTQLESMFPDEQAAPRVEVSAIPAVTASHEMVLAIERRAAAAAATRRRRNGSKERGSSPSGAAAGAAGAAGDASGRSGTSGGGGPGSPPGPTGAARPGGDAAGDAAGAASGSGAGTGDATAAGAGGGGGLDDGAGGGSGGGGSGPLAGGLASRQAKAALADPQLIALSKALGYRTVYDLFKTTSDGERDLLGLHDTYAAEALRSLAKSSILPASAFHAAALAREVEERAREMRNIERRRIAAAARAAAIAEADAAGGGIMALGGNVSEAGSGASAASAYNGSAATGDGGSSGSAAASAFDVGFGGSGGGSSGNAQQRRAAASAAAAATAGGAGGGSGGAGAKGSPGRRASSLSPSASPARGGRKSISVTGTGAGPSSPGGRQRRASASPTGRPQRRLSLVDQPVRMRDGRRLSHIDKRELEAAAKAATGLYTVTTSGGVILSSRGGRKSGLTTTPMRPHSGTGPGSGAGRRTSGVGGMASPGGGGFHGFPGGDGAVGGLQGDHPYMYAQYQEQQMQQHMAGHGQAHDEDGNTNGNGNGEGLVSPGLGPSGTLRREAKEEKRRDMFIMTARSGGLTDPKQRRIMERIVAAAAAEEAVSGGAAGLASMLLQPPSEVGSLASSLSAGALSMLYGGASDATLTPFPSLVPGHGPHGASGGGAAGIAGHGHGHGGDMMPPSATAIAKVDALAHALASAQLLQQKQMQMHMQQGQGQGDGADGSGAAVGIGRGWALPQSTSSSGAAGGAGGAASASSTHDEFAFTSGSGGGGSGRGSPIVADGAGTRPHSRSPGRDSSRDMREAALDPTSREAAILRKLDAFMRANPLPARGAGASGAGGGSGNGGLRAARGVGGGGLLLPPLAGRPGSSGGTGGGLNDAAAVIAPVDMMSAALRAASDRMGYSADTMLERTTGGDGHGYGGQHGHGAPYGSHGSLLASGAMGGGVTVMGGGSGGFGSIAGLASPLRAGGHGHGQAHSLHMQLQLGRQSPRQGMDTFGLQHPQSQNTQPLPGLPGVDTFSLGALSLPAGSGPVNSSSARSSSSSGMGDIAGIAEDDDDDGHHDVDDATGKATIKTSLSPSSSSSPSSAAGITRIMTSSTSPTAAAVGTSTIAPARGAVGSLRVAGAGAGAAGAGGAAGAAAGVAPARGGVGSVRGLPALDLVPSFTAGAGGLLMGPGAFNPNASTNSLSSMRGNGPPGASGLGGLGLSGGVGGIGLPSSPVHGSGGAGGFTVPSLSSAGLGGTMGGLGSPGLFSPSATHASANGGVVSLAALDRGGGGGGATGIDGGGSVGGGSASGDAGAPTEELVTRMLVNRSKTRPLMVAFTYTSTSSLLHRALPDIRTVGTAGAQAIGRTVPVPWARYGGVDTFKAHGGSSGSGSDVRSEVAAAQKRIADTVKALAAESRAFSSAAIEESKRRREELETAGPVKVARAALEVRQERMRRAQIKATESQAARAARQNSRNNMTVLGGAGRAPGGRGGVGVMDMDDDDDGLGRDEFTDRLEQRAAEAEAAARAASEGRLDRIPRSILPSGSLVSTGSVSLLDDASSSFGPEDSINSYGLPRDPNKLREVLGLGGGTFTAAAVREKYAFKIARQTLGSSPPPSSR